MTSRSELPWSPGSRVLRQFWLLWLLIVSGSLGWNCIESNESRLSVSLFAISICVGCLGLIAPDLMRPVWTASLIATFPVGWLVSQALTLGFFLGVITPLGLILRRLGHDPLKLRSTELRSTYWENRIAPPSPRNYLRPF